MGCSIQMNTAKCVLAKASNGKRVKMLPVLTVNQPTQMLHVHIERERGRELFVRTGFTWCFGLIAVYFASHV